MLEFIGSAIASVVGGGATGIIGIVAQRYFDLQNKRLDIELKEKSFNHEVAMVKANAEIMQMEFAARTEIASIEATSREAVEDSRAFALSLQDPKLFSERVKHTHGQSWVLVFLDFIRGIVRPGLTIYLCVLTTLIYLHAKSLLITKPLEPAQALKIVEYIIHTILYLTTTVTLQWFGTRNKNKGPKL